MQKAPKISFIILGFSSVGSRRWGYQWSRRMRNWRAFVVPTLVSANFPLVWGVQSDPRCLKAMGKIRANSKLLFINYCYSIAHIISECLCIYLKEHCCLLGGELNSAVLELKTNCFCRIESGLVALQVQHFLAFPVRKLWVCIELKCVCIYIYVCIKMCMESFPLLASREYPEIWDWWDFTMFCSERNGLKKMR